MTVKIRKPEKHNVLQWSFEPIRCKNKGQRKNSTLITLEFFHYVGTFLNSIPREFRKIRTGTNKMGIFVN